MRSCTRGHERDSWRGRYLGGAVGDAAIGSGEWARRRARFRTARAFLVRAARRAARGAPAGALQHAKTGADI